jgi:hypothetical protein
MAEPLDGVAHGRAPTDREKVVRLKPLHEKLRGRLTQPITRILIGELRHHVGFQQPVAFLDLALKRQAPLISRVYTHLDDAVAPIRPTWCSSQEIENLRFARWEKSSPMPHGAWGVTTKPSSSLFARAVNLLPPASGVTGAVKRAQMTVTNRCVLKTGPHVSWFASIV